MAQNPIGINLGSQSYINFDDGGGTVNTQIVTVGTLQSGTLSSIPNIPGGTITNLVNGTLGLLANGTLSSAGTVTGVGTITNLGTLSAGTINLVTPGTATTNLGKAGGNTGGTTDVGVAPMFVQVGTLGTASVEADGQYGAPFMDGNRVAYFNNAYKLDSTNDSITAILDGNGTVAAVTNLVNGTVRITVGTIAAGTINTGTINAGTINAGTFSISPKPSVNILTVGTAGTTGVGTLVAAPGVGTSIYVTGFSIDGDSSVLGTAECCLSWGTAVTGSAVLFRATLATLNDVAIQSFSYPVNGGITNSPLTYQIISGAGTMAWNVQYFIQ